MKIIDDFKKKKSWQRLPDESDLAYSYFTSYMKMGPERSLAKVGQKHGKKEHYRKQLAKWSSKFNWVERAAAFDENLMMQVVEQQELILKKAKGFVLSNINKVLREVLKAAESDRIDKLTAAKMLLDIAGVKPDEAQTGEKELPTYQQINNYFYKKLNGLENDSE